jgi:cbb3-type cytochrome oxidase subunit 3
MSPIIAILLLSLVVLALVFIAVVVSFFRLWIRATLSKAHVS